MHREFWRGLTWGLMVAVIACILGFAIGGGFH